MRRLTPFSTCSSMLTFAGSELIVMISLLSGDEKAWTPRRSSEPHPLGARKFRPSTGSFVRSSLHAAKASKTRSERAVRILTAAGDETAVDANQRFFLIDGKARIELDRVLDAVCIIGVGRAVEQPGLCVHRFGGDVERVCDLLEHVGGRLVETALDLTQIRVGDFRDL